MTWFDKLVSWNAVSPARAPIPDAGGPFDFIVVDVETADRNRHSICQIGVVGFRDGTEVFAEEVLVDPECDFDPFNVGIHGIGAAQVQSARNFAGVHAWVRGRLNDRLVLSHSSFDQQALAGACRRHERPEIECRWGDTVTVARQAWPRLPNHKLPTLARHLGLGFRHHSAVEDARVAGLVMIGAIEATAIPLEDWFRVDKSPPTDVPRDRGVFERRPLARRGDGDGPLVGRRISMTGVFSQPKAEVAEMILLAGGEVLTGVTKRTTILLLGDQDPSVLAGKDKSSKHLKAEQLMATGQKIEIWREDDLLRALGS